jgi:hypothetical protein
MALIKLQKANEEGEAVGTLFVNTDQVLAISAGKAATEIQMSDGRTRWVKEGADEVAALTKKSS